MGHDLPALTEMSTSAIGSLSARAGVVVIGANGGIGAALIDALRNDERIVALHALSRRPVEDADGIVMPRNIDILDEESVRVAAERCASIGELDLVIVASGMLHRDGEISPEKRMSELSIPAMQELFAVNTIGPAIVAKHFLPRLRPRGKTVFAAISARVGSIADNRMGGWASYRASKAALNMLIRTLSIEQARSHPDSVCVSLHPGTVDTGLSRPFQSRVPEGQLFQPEYSASCLLQVIDQLGPEDTGGFFAWDGQRIQY